MCVRTYNLLRPPPPHMKILDPPLINIYLWCECRSSMNECSIFAPDETVAPMINANIYMFYVTLTLLLILLNPYPTSKQKPNHYCSNSDWSEISWQEQLVEIERLSGHHEYQTLHIVEWSLHVTYVYWMWPEPWTQLEQNQTSCPRVFMSLNYEWLYYCTTMNRMVCPECLYITDHRRLCKSLYPHL